MVHCAEGHYRRVWVPSTVQGVRGVYRWICLHCEAKKTSPPHSYSDDTSPTTRMTHVINKHDNAPRPKRQRAAPSSPASVPPADALLPPPPVPSVPQAPKRRKVEVDANQRDLPSSFAPIRNSLVMPAIANMFADCGLAHHLIERPSFIAAFEAFRNATIPIGNRRALKQHQSILAQQLREKVVKAARTHCRSHPLTIGIDGWTNVRQDKVTNVVILCGGVAYYWCSIVNTSHHNTAKWLLEPLLQVLDDIKGHGLIFSALVTDNEAANKTLHNLLLPHYPFLIRSPCAAHLLQLCVRKALIQPTVEPIITAMEELLAAFKYKANRLTLKTLQLTASANLTSYCLIRPNDTRWSSWLYAATRLLKLKAYCDVVVPQQPLFWVNLAEIVRFLQPFQVATDIMQSDSSTMYDLYAQFTSILTHVDNLPSSSCFFTARDDIHNLTIAVLEKHVDLDLIVACALLSFDKATPSIFPSRMRSAQKTFCEFAAQYALYWNVSAASTIEEARNQAFAEWTDWTAATPGTTFEDMEGEAEHLRAHHCLQHQQQSTHQRNFTRWNPRAAWANHVHAAPILCLGAIALLSVAGSEAAVERTFSAQGRIHSKYRNRLKDEAVEVEMYVKFNEAALRRKIEARDGGNWVELTEDWEEAAMSPLITASLFLTRIREEVMEEEAEEEREAQDEQKTAEEQKREESEQRVEGERKEAREGREVHEVKEEWEEKDEEKDEQPSLPSVSRIPIAPLPASADDVHRFVVNYVRTVPWKSGIHAKFRWTERYVGHLSNASQTAIPPINDTVTELQRKVMKYVRSDQGPPPPDTYVEEVDIVDPLNDSEL